MSRLRADGECTPPGYMREYYSQRASAGLIVTESTAVAPYGAGYPPIPGIYSARQAEAWRDIVSAVHDAGGLMAAQLWHVGRARKEEDGAGRPPGWAIADEIKPHELEPQDLANVPRDFAAAARVARSVGFDSVEIHSGNGFLLDRFLRAATNHRRDDHGGSLQNRARLTLAILAAVIEVYGANRVGIRVSPSATVAGGPDNEREDVFAHLLGSLEPLGLAYVHATRTTTDDRAHGSGPGIPLEWVRSHFKGNLIGAGDFSLKDGEKALSDGVLDAVVYGRPFLANPDLPRRFATGAALNVPDPATFYAGGPNGLIDYPSLP
jgi:N-ethylmaleimide reductase